MCAANHKCHVFYSQARFLKGKTVWDSKKFRITVEQVFQDPKFFYSMSMDHTVR